MEPNQNPPSEREWTIEEREEFFASQDAMTGLFNGMASNAPMEKTAPITLKDLQEMVAKFREQFPESLPYRNGADMSQETWNALNAVLKRDGVGQDGSGLPYPYYTMSLSAIEIHIVPGIPFGEVEECSCKERAKEKSNGTR
jgi:hypothetical protein